MRDHQVKVEATETGTKELKPKHFRLSFFIVLFPGRPDMLVTLMPRGGRGAAGGRPGGWKPASERRAFHDIVGHGPRARRPSRFLPPHFQRSCFLQFSAHRKQSLLFITIKLLQTIHGSLPLSLREIF